MRRPTLGAVVALLLCCGLAFGQAGFRPREVPRPDLGSMEPAVRNLLGNARAVLDGVLATPGAGRQRLAEAYGGMGQLYLAYELDDAAIAALENAAHYDSTKLDWFYYLGVAYQRHGDLEAAVEELRRARQLAAADAPTLLRLGGILLDLNHLHAARASFADAMAVDPEADTAVAARYGLGLVLAQQKAFEAAVEHLENVLARQPGATIVHYPLGLAYRELGRLDEARRHLEQRGAAPVRFSDPLVEHLRSLEAGAGVHIARGRDAVRQGDTAAAIESFRRAIAEDPDNVTARQELATQLLAAGEAEAAEAEYREVLDRRPDDALAHYNLATVLGRRGETDAAVDHYRAAVEAAPDFIEAAFNLANTLMRAEAYEEAAVEFRRVAALDPESATASRQLAACLDRLGRHDEAAAALRELIRRRPEDAESHLRLAAVLAGQDRLEEAAAELERALGLELTPRRQALAWGALADVDRRRGETRAAVKHYERALELEPDFFQARLQLAELLVSAGRPVDAASQYAAVLEDRPDLEPAHRGRIDALLGARRYAEAREAFEQAREALPRDPRLADAWARFLATCPDEALRDGDRALELAQSLASQAPRAEYAETVAMALAELGRFEEAVVLQERLVAEAGAAGRTDLLPTLERNLASYRDRRPCRAPWLD